MEWFEGLDPESLYERGAESNPTTSKNQQTKKTPPPPNLHLSISGKTAFVLFLLPRLSGRFFDIL